ncbi:MAG: rRNA maturation RNase YbeY [Gemmatimonadota bacterium]
MREDDALRVHVNPGAFGDVSAEVLRNALLHVLDAEGVEEAEFSLTLVDDDAIRELNRRYLERDRPTDVIAFSLGEPEAPLGDVYVGMEQARRQADEAGVLLEEELVRLAVHGTLHVLGWDHPEGGERVESEMFRRQEALVREILDDAPARTAEG